MLLMEEYQQYKSLQGFIKFMLNFLRLLGTCYEGLKILGIVLKYQVFPELNCDAEGIEKQQKSFDMNGNETY